ncbi:MAG: exodeoxyribonuclease VII small subunit [Lachnospiraceae bacterium]|jgi:exodeoxyribonuclease VII small subunit|nr:exodeoxyribonuclease VII small subunit [Eubacterium sp.]MCI6795841.1 exodeoxyribonuclease VII small subunit [Lachnospiraceae bacterium]MDD6685466.1 exodeoxyribonuclease VII small subunit [Lachnospiraceae bacterium]HBB61154.1 exodeoxyribonuclease VII small subunit [Lachnospiraceae bacterium]HCE78605.1 exodeoxyribonuclease VII small subunit [Lachnospiraceae bacterium]
MDGQKKEEQLTLEESFAELDRLVERLEDRDIPLEESFSLYKRGMDLLTSCKEKIDTVEKKMLQITEDGEINEF